MEDESQPPLFRSSAPITPGPYWRFAIPIVMMIAFATYFISLAAMSGGHSEGALNGLPSLFAGVLAVAALIGSTVLAGVVRLLVR